MQLLLDMAQLVLLRNRRLSADCNPVVLSALRPLLLLVHLVSVRLAVLEVLPEEFLDLIVGLFEETRREDVLADVFRIVVNPLQGFLEVGGELLVRQRS